MEIDDLEFERLVERVVDLWAAGHNTAEMATVLNTTEAKTAYVVMHMMEGKYMCKEEEAQCPQETGS